MPFKSKKQSAACFGGYIEGMDKKDCEEWADKTDYDEIPKKVKKKSKKNESIYRGITFEDILKYGTESEIEFLKESIQLNESSGIIDAFIAQGYGPDEAESVYDDMISTALYDMGGDPNMLYRAVQLALSDNYLDGEHAEDLANAIVYAQKEDDDMYDESEKLIDKLENNEI